MKEVVHTKKRMGREFQECQLEMSTAKFAAGEFGVTVRDSIKTKTNVNLAIQIENVAGVMKPTFILCGIDGNNDDSTAAIGITGGGQAIMKAQDKFKKYLALLVAIATLQAQFVTVERELKLTNRRVNALEFVIIPKIENVIKWINSELDELDREDFYRLKCVQDKKQEAKDAEEAEIAAKKKKAEAGGAVDQEKADEEFFEEKDNADDDEDEDVIF